MKSQPIRVFVVDDHLIFNQAMQTLLAELEGIEVAGSATNGEDALKSLASLPADLVLMDISMPGIDGLEATSRLKANQPEVKVLLLTMHDQPEYVERLRDSLADGYLLKDCGRKELLQAIGQVMSGQPYYSSSVVQTVMQGFRKSASGNEKPRLTRRETEVLEAILEELTTQQIADKLFISEQTVLTHRKNLHRKFDVHNTAGLVKKAIRFGFGEA